VQSYVETVGLPACITRCGNNYGPYQYPEKLIPFFILRLKNGEKVPVYGDGLNVRDWIHVSDHAAGVIHVFFNGKPGEVYNIGADNQQNNMTMTRAILAQMGYGDEMINFVADRPGHDRRYALDTTKIRTQLGWKPLYQFEDGLKETIRWYQDNAAWIDGVLARQKDSQHVMTGAQWLKPKS
jgi:dTDP-glucose 4,6-dehydratase